jgi:hypothetical protein
MSSLFATPHLTQEVDVPSVTNHVYQHDWYFVGIKMTFLDSSQTR